MKILFMNPFGTDRYNGLIQRILDQAKRPDVEVVVDNLSKGPTYLDYHYYKNLIVGELIELHLLEADSLDKPLSKFVGGHRAVSKVGWTADNRGTVWIDGKGTAKSFQRGTSGFAPVPETVWMFHIGGYQVCEKWLKDRKGRTLSNDDIVHYQKIVVALNETIRLMKEIDEVVERIVHIAGSGSATATTDPAQLVRDALLEGGAEGLIGAAKGLATDLAMNQLSRKVPFAAGFVGIAQVAFHQGGPAGWAEAQWGASFGKGSVNTLRNSPYRRSTR